MTALPHGRVGRKRSGIVDLDRLIVMKPTAFRRQKRVHLLVMTDAGPVACLPAEPRARLGEVFANPAG